MSGNRPKVFQLIKNEFAEVKEQQATIENKLALRIDKTGLRLDAMQDEIDKFENLAKMLTTKADSLDHFTREIRVLVANSSEKAQKDVYELKSEFNTRLRLALNDIKGMEFQLVTS